MPQADQTNVDTSSAPETTGTGDTEEPETTGTGDTEEPALAEPIEPAPTEPSTRRFPAVIWWITALHLTALLAYSFLLPTYRSPDEPLHVDLAHLFSEEMRYPAWDEGDTSAGIEASLQLMRFGNQSAHLTADEAVPKQQRPSIEDLEVGNDPGGINQQSQHPPLYYVVTGTSIWAIEGVVGDPVGSFALETWLYRLIGLLFVAPLPLIIWRTASVLGAPSPVGVAAALVPLAIPQLTHIGSSATNDTLSMLLFWAVTPVVLRVARGALGPRPAALAGALTGLGLLTKGFATVVLVWMALALGLALLRAGLAAWRQVATSGAVYLAATVLFGGWWPIRNVVVYGELTPSRFDQLVGDHPGATGFIDFLGEWGTRTTWRFWGDFGWYDTQLPGLAVVVATAVCLALIAIGIAVSVTNGAGSTRSAGSRGSSGTTGSSGSTGSSSRADRALLVAPLVLLVVSQIQVAFAEHQRTSLYPGLQGRYWFGAVAAASVLIALGVAVLLRRRLAWSPLVVLCGVAAMQLLALSTLLGFYWGEPGSALIDRVRAIVAWTPLPGEVIGLVAVAGAGVTAMSVITITLFSVRSPATEPT